MIIARTFFGNLSTADLIDMATLIYAALASGGLMYYSHTQNKLREARLTPSPKHPRPYYAPITHISKQFGSQEHDNGRFRSATPFIDERGAPAWRVDFGDFSQCIMYRDPSIQVA